MFEKNGASKIVHRMNGLLKSRKGRRPARVETLIKKGSQSGADLRIPLMGGTKFPTNDSLSQARSTLKEHQNVGKPKMVRPVVQPVYGVNAMKLGSDFSDDPLVQYLKKTAQEAKVDSEGKLDDNIEEMKTSPQEPALASHPVGTQRGEKTHKDWRDYLNEHFSNKEGITGKYLDHHHDYKEGVVDRVLKSHQTKV